MDFLSLLDPDFIAAHIPSFLATDLARQVFLFSMAAWIHSGRVKKEIKNQFQTLADAIHGVESKLGPVIESLDSRVKILETTILPKEK